MFQERESEIKGLLMHCPTLADNEYSHWEWTGLHAQSEFNQLIVIFITHRATTLYFSTIWTLKLSCPGTSIRVQLPACEIKNILPSNQKCVTSVPHNLSCNIKSLTRSFLLLYVALFSVMDVWVLTYFPSNNWKNTVPIEWPCGGRASKRVLRNFKWNWVSHLSEQKSFAGVTESQQQHSGPRFTGPPKIPKEHCFRKTTR